MSGKSWRELLMLYLSGELSGEDQAAFDQYLAESEACRAELDEWRAVAEAVRGEADSRVGALPALPSAFYRRLQPTHSLNGSFDQTNMEQETMTTIAHPQKRKNSGRGKSVSLAAALVSVLVFVGTLLLARSPQPFGEPLFAGMQAQETATQGEIFVTATAIIVGATGTAACDQEGICATTTATPTVTASASPTLVFTATPILAQPEVASVVPTIMAPLASQIDPIISAPARLSAGFTIFGDGVVVDMDASPDGRLLVVSRNATTLHSLWLVNLETGEQIAILIYDVPLISPTFSADGTQVYVSTMDGRVFVLHIG